MRRIARFYLATGLVLCSLLAACGAESTPTPIPVAAAPTDTARSNLPLTWTPAPAVTPAPRLSEPSFSTSNKPLAITPLPLETPQNITRGLPDGLQTNCTQLDYVRYPTLSQQIEEAQDIVQVQVGNVGPLVWNTADGKQPPSGCNMEHAQYSSMQITVRDSYKGLLAAGSKLTIWWMGVPVHSQGNYNYFPQIGEILLLFLGDTYNLRPDTPNDPLNTRSVVALYRQPSAAIDKWVSQTTNTPFSLVYLKALLKDPTLEPTPTPFPPSPTPYVRAGQTFQPTRYYRLDRATSIYFKGAPSKLDLTGDLKSGDKRFNQLVKVLDQPLNVVEIMSSYSFSSDQMIVPFGFRFSDETYLPFVYEPQTNSLIHWLKDGRNIIRLAAPPDLKAILDL